MVGWFVVAVLELASGLRSRNLRVVGCRAFTWNGIIYDCFVVDGEVGDGGGGGEILQFVTQGARGMAAVTGGKVYVHRLVSVWV
jgi:hypothetical protein